MAIVMPYEHPVYRLNMNVGMQCNYNLPWNNTEFTHPMYWDQRGLGPSSNDTRYKRDVDSGEFYNSLEKIIES